MSCELNLEQKFARALIKLRELRPFYSAIYESIPHIATDEIETMAVTGRSFLYNEKYSDSLTFEEFLFVILHEVCHIALMHVVRAQGRNNLLFNIACDLYVNKALSVEFDIKPGELDCTKTVRFKEGGLFCSSIDLDKDNIEDIYDILATQANKNGFFTKDSGVYHFRIKGSDTSYDKYNVYEFDINKETYIVDLLGSGNSCSSEELEAENKRILAEASVKYDMLYKGTGSSSGILAKYVRDILKSKLDWRKLLRKYCIMLTSKDSSYAMPDKRMFYQRAIYPGNVSESTLSLERVKICFDRSGSISDTDMQYFYGQVKGILKEFKINAEVIDWDTQILGIGDINHRTSINKAFIVRGGGTSPNCLFEYFDSRECKIKPRVTVIFTDGYVSLDEKPKWVKKYKDTIWVMTRHYNKDFRPKIGKVAIAKFDK